MASQPTPPKKTKGRQKIKMERMEKDSNRQVTFSKRHCGLFKKASELCTLCGVEAAIIVFSPGKKAFSFGHPSVEAVVNRYNFSRLNPSSSSSLSLDLDINSNLGLGFHPSAGVGDLNHELALVNSRMEDEKKRNEEMIANKTVLDLPIEELSLDQLEHFKAALEELKERVVQQGDNIMMLEAAAKPPMAPMAPTPMAPIMAPMPPTPMAPMAPTPMAPIMAPMPPTPMAPMAPMAPTPMAPTPNPPPYPMPIMGVDYPVFDSKEDVILGYRPGYY